VSPVSVQTKCKISVTYDSLKYGSKNASVSECISQLGVNITNNIFSLIFVNKAFSALYHYNLVTGTNKQSYSIINY